MSELDVLKDGVYFALTDDQARVMQSLLDDILGASVKRGVTNDM